MDLRRGAFLVGTEVVSDFGGGRGIALDCFKSGALLTQKWIVVLGTEGTNEDPMIFRDQPACQRAFRRDSISTRGSFER